MTNKDIEKQAAGYAAAELIQEGMTVGLGTGTTAEFFIERLGERCCDGLKIKAVASSEKSKALALSYNIPFIDLETLASLDVTVDGADEVDSQKRMIKGGGGALLREKILASMCNELIIIVDSKKCVDKIGAFPLAIEILPYAWPATIKHIERYELTGALRLNAEGEKYKTDNGNYIFDISLKNSQNSSEPEEINALLQAIPGVLETGFFFNLATCIIIGKPDGKVDFKR